MISSHMAVNLKIQVGISMLDVPKLKYHTSIRILHWLMAVLILGMIAVGWYMSELPKEDANRGTLYFFHKSFGVLILILVTLRLSLRFITKVPPLPFTLHPLVRKLANFGHIMLYIFMFAIPVSGIMMSNMFGHGIPFFGIDIPKIFSENKVIGGIAHDSHEIMAYSLLALVAIHVSAVIKHRFFDKNKENNVLDRML